MKIASLVLLSALFTSEARAMERFALVIGSNRSPDEKTAPLRYADDDAIAIHKLLIEAGLKSELLVSLDADTARLHPDLRVPRPTIEALQRTFERQLAKMRDAPDPKEFLLFYSGHGGVDHGEGFIVIEGGRLFRSKLHEGFLKRSPATRNHVIVDACKSYFMAFAKGPGGQRSPHSSVLSSTQLPHNTGFVLSTSSGRDSHEWDRFQSGVFSHQVRSALRGGADANRDASISYAELGAFLHRANASILNPKYRPDFAVRPPGVHPGDLGQPVLAWPGQADSVTFGAKTLQRAYVEGPTGERIIDVHVRRDQTVRLFIPETRPLFVRAFDERREWIIQQRGHALLSLDTERPASISRKGALHLAFENLFRSPFGPPDVADYAAAYQAKPDPLLLRPPSVVERSSLQKTAWLKPTTGIAALVLAVTGASMTGWALERRFVGDGLQSDELFRRDAQIRRLNAAAITLYSTAAVAGGIWLFLQLTDF